jgi:ABC-type cobalamin transport system ATPase subunit
MKGVCREGSNVSVMYGSHILIKMVAGQFSIKMTMLLMAIMKSGLVSVPSLQLYDISTSRSHNHRAYLAQMNKSKQNHWWYFYVTL